MQVPLFYPPTPSGMKPQAGAWLALPSELSVCSKPSGFVPFTPAPSPTCKVASFPPLCSEELRQQRLLLERNQQQQQQMHLYGQFEQKVIPQKKHINAELTLSAGSEAARAASEREVSCEFKDRQGFSGAYQEASPSGPSAGSSKEKVADSLSFSPEEGIASQCEHRPPREQVMAILKRVLKSLPEADLLEIQKWIAALQRLGKEQSSETPQIEEVLNATQKTQLTDENPHGRFSAQSQPHYKQSAVYVQPGLQTRSDVFDGTAVSSSLPSQLVSSVSPFFDGSWICPPSQRNSGVGHALMASEFPAPLLKEGLRLPCLMPPPSALQRLAVGECPDGGVYCTYAGSYASFARRLPGLVVEGSSRGSSQNDHRVKTGPMCRLPVTSYDALQAPRPAMLKRHELSRHLTPSSCRRSFSALPSLHKHSNLSSFLCCMRTGRMKSDETSTQLEEAPPPCAEEKVGNESPCQAEVPFVDEKDREALVKSDGIDVAETESASRRVEESEEASKTRTSEEEEDFGYAPLQAESRLNSDAEAPPESEAQKQPCPSAVLLEALLNEVRVLRQSIGSRKSQELSRLDEDYKRIQSQQRKVEEAAAAAVRDMSDARLQQAFLEQQRDALFEARQRLQGMDEGEESSAASKPLASIGTSEELFGVCCLPRPEKPKAQLASESEPLHCMLKNA